MIAAALALSTAASAQCVERLLPPSGGLDVRFGDALAVEGERVAVGAPRAAPVPNGRRGAVYVYVLHGQWVLEAELTGSGTVAGDQLGYSVAMEDTLLAAGSTGNDEAAPGAGAVYVYERGASGWSESAKLLPSQPELGMEFGSAVALSEGRLFVGARGAVPGGAVFVFERGPGGWMEVARLEAGSSGSSIGRSLDAEGERVLVGGHHETFSFVNQGGGWVLEDELTPSQPFAGFGTDVALDGERAVVGSPDTNSAVLFRRQGSAWVQRGQLSAPPSAPGTSFGHGVDLAGDWLAVGAPGVNGESGNDVGALFLFRRDGAGWELTYSFVDSAQPAQGRLGDAVAVQGSTFFAGAPAWYAIPPGSVLVYDLPLSTRSFCFCDQGGTCANGEPTSGCENSTHAGSTLVPCGSDGAAADDLLLTAADMPPGAPALLISGTRETLAPFGDGRLCTGGAVARLEVRFGPSATYGPGLAARGGFAAGDRPLFQVWYRDPAGPCGAGFNLTSGVEITYAP
jgi:hypothetical protein